MKILKYTYRSIMLVLIIGAITLGLILEPDLNIPNFAKLDIGKLDDIDNIIQVSDSNEESFNSIIYGNIEHTPIEKVQKSTIDAFLSIEDRRFYSHQGIDYIRIATAVKNDIKTMSFKEGASTISQQLVKNTHLTNEKKISRKLQEMRLAVDLERRFDKDKILEYYLNILYFGNNIYGIGNAAKVIFDKDVQDLEIHESATLAGIINNPKIYSPYINPQNSLKRRNLVLNQMLKYEKISQEEYEYAINQELAPFELNKGSTQYMYNVIDEACSILNCSEKELYNKNLKIQTYYDSGYENLSQNALNSFILPQSATAQIIIIKNDTGAILSYYSNSRKNLSQMLRQPGSTIKPLLSYAPAIEGKNILPITPILDEKINYNNYSPSNYKDKYEGWTSVQNALINSSNICAIKLLEMNGIEKAKSYAGMCGIEFDENDNNLNLALGGMSRGVNLTNLCGAYQMFANGGKFIKSSSIKTIFDETGNIIYKNVQKRERVFSDETAFLINSMLSECAKTGTAKLINGAGNICAKTGTVGDETGNSDAYCIAYNPKYTVGVWIGNVDKKEKIGITGGGYPTLIAKKILESEQIKTYEEFSMPGTVYESEIDINLLNSKHKIVAAHSGISPLYRKKAYFTKSYPLQVDFYDKSILSDDKSFYNFINDKNNYSGFNDFNIV